MRTSEDKVRRKDKCWSVRAVYILVKLPDVSGPSLGEVGRYRPCRSLVGRMVEIDFLFSSELVQAYSI